MGQTESLNQVTLSSGGTHGYRYDYRTRRVTRTESGQTTAIVYSGGLSVQEYVTNPATPTVEYQRGDGMGGAVGVCGCGV